MLPISGEVVQRNSEAIINSADFHGSAHRQRMCDPAEVRTYPCKALAGQELSSFVPACVSREGSVLGLATRPYKNSAAWESRFEFATEPRVIGKWKTRCTTG